MPTLLSADVFCGWGLPIPSHPLAFLENHRLLEGALKVTSFKNLFSAVITFRKMPMISRLGTPVILLEVLPWKPWIFFQVCTQGSHFY